jgi:serine/threonine-protein kinase
MAACLYEALSGRRAYPGKDAVEVAKRIQKNRPQAIAQTHGLSPRVDAVLWRAMALNPDDRYASCREFAAAMSEALLGVREVAPTLPESSSFLQPEPEGRSRKVGFAVLYLLIGATVATAMLRLFPMSMSKGSTPQVPPTDHGPELRAAHITHLPHQRKE